MSEHWWRSRRLVVGMVAWLVVPGAAAKAADDVTFARDVAPILQQKCQICHQPDSIAPMSLLTYQDTRPWARSIRQKVLAREMPPWHLALDDLYFPRKTSYAKPQVYCFCTPSKILSTHS